MVRLGEVREDHGGANKVSLAEAVILRVDVRTINKCGYSPVKLH